MAEGSPKAKNDDSIFSPNLAFSYQPHSTRKIARYADLKWGADLKDYERGTPVCMSEPSSATFVTDAVTNRDSSSRTVSK
jgi:hypothetical protein